MCGEATFLQIASKDSASDEHTIEHSFLVNPKRRWFGRAWADAKLILVMKGQGFRCVIGETHTAMCITTSTLHLDAHNIGIQERRISVQHWKNTQDSRDGHRQITRIALYVSTRTWTTLRFKEQGNGNAQAYCAWPCDATKLCGVEKHEDLCLDFLRMALMHPRC